MAEKLLCAQAFPSTLCSRSLPGEWRLPGDLTKSLSACFCLHLLSMLCILNCHMPTGAAALLQCFELDGIIQMQNTRYADVGTSF